MNRLAIPADRIKTIYYAGDPDVFRPADDCERRELRLRLGLYGTRPLVLFVGALGDTRKGFDTLFSAWKQLCGRPTWDANLIVVGAGAKLDYWKRRAQDEGLGTRIRFLGFRRDVPDLVRACDAMVAPTRYEAFGLAVQEALYCGVASIVSRDAGVAERYPADLEDLLLGDPENADQLADRLNSWRADISSYRRRFRLLSARLRKYTWNDMAREMLDAIDTHPIHSDGAALDRSSG